MELDMEGETEGDVEGDMENGFPDQRTASHLPIPTDNARLNNAFLS